MADNGKGMEAGGQKELVFSRRRKGVSYSVSSSERTNALGDLESVDSLILLEKYVSSLEEEL
ncbi:MAG: hypothetical protein V2A34_03990, partial [Lentisphaerota bacterium]